MKKNGKPVRKCYGCELNLGDHCAICQKPHERWNDKTCSGYNNQRLIEAYGKMLLRPINEQKNNRKLIAKQRRTKEHYKRTMERFIYNKVVSTNNFQNMKSI